MLPSLEDGKWTVGMEGVGILGRFQRKLPWPKIPAMNKGAWNPALGTFFVSEISVWFSMFHTLSDDQLESKRGGRHREGRTVPPRGRQRSREPPTMGSPNDGEGADFWCGPEGNLSQVYPLGRLSLEKLQQRRVCTHWEVESCPWRRFTQCKLAPERLWAHGAERGFNSSANFQAIWPGIFFYTQHLINLSLSQRKVWNAPAEILVKANQ